MQTKNAIGYLVNRYRAVLQNCHIKNIFMGLVVAGALTLGGGASEAAAASSYTDAGNRAGAPIESTVENQRTAEDGTLVVASVASSATDSVSNSKSTRAAGGTATWDDTAAGKAGGETDPADNVFKNVVLDDTTTVAGITTIGNFTLEGFATAEENGLLVAKKDGTAGSLTVGAFTANLGVSGTKSYGTLGNVELGAGSTLNATGGGIFNTGNITTGAGATSNVTINEGTTIASSGAIEATNVNITHGNLTATGAVKVTNVTLGSIVAGDGGGGTISSDGNIEIVTLKADGSTPGDMIGTPRVNTVSSKANITITDKLSAVTGVLNLVATDNITLTGGLNATTGSAINIQAGTANPDGAPNANGKLTVGDSGIQTTATSTANINVNELAVTAGGVTLNAGSNLIVKGAADIVGDTILTGAGAQMGSLITTAGAGGAAGNVTLNADSTLIVTGDANIAGALNLTGAGAQMGSLSAGATTLGAGSTLIVNGLAKIAGALNLGGAGAGAQMGSLTTTGVGDVTLGTGSALIVTNAATINGALALTGAAAQMGSLTTTTTTAGAGAVTLTGSSLTVGGDTTLAAGSALTVNDGSTANLGGILSTDTAITVGGATTGSNLLIGTLTNTSATGLAVNVGDAGGVKSIVQVGSIDSTTGGALFNVNKGSNLYLGTNADTVNAAMLVSQTDNPGKVFDSVLAIGGTHNFTNNGIAIGDATTAIANKIDINGNTLLVADVTGYNNTTTTGIIELGTGGTMDISKTSGVAIGGAFQVGQNYILVSGLGANGLTQDTAIIGADGKLILAAQPASSRMVNMGLTYDKTGGNLVMGSTLISASTVFTGMDASVAKFLDTYYTSRTKVNPYLDGLIGASSAVSNAEIAATIESSMNASSMVGVVSVISDLSNASVTNMASRTSTKNLYANNSYKPTAASAGGMSSDSLGVWVTPLYQNTSADGFTSGSYKYGYDSDSVGASFGVDYTFQEDFRMGVAFHIGSGDSTSIATGLTAFTPTKNNFDYAGASVYGGYVYDDFVFSADVGYTNTDNRVRQDNLLGNQTASDFDVSIITAGIKGEYMYSSTPTMDIVPYAGVRFNSVEIDAYDTKYLGSTIFNAERLQSDTFAIPIGVNFTKNIITETGWHVNPSLTLGVQFTVGDLDVNQVVTTPGTIGSAIMTNEVADATTFQGGLGIGFAKEDTSVALDYYINNSSNLTSHGVTGTVRLEF